MNNKKTFIKQVANNNEKAKTYKEIFSRFNKAKSNDFYFECLWLLYSLLEDRTSSLLYHLGFVGEKNRNKVTGSKKIKLEIRLIFQMNDAQDKYSFDSFFGKIDRIKTLLKWSEGDAKTSNFAKVVQNTILPFASDSNFMATIDYLNNEWREERNQLTHALLCKNQQDAIDKIKPLVEKGYEAFRTIDNAIKLIKKENIRKKFKIQ